jgi:hypothetical protein
MSSTRPRRSGSRATSSGRDCSKYDCGFVGWPEIRQLAGYASAVRASLRPQGLPRPGREETALAILVLVLAEVAVVAVARHSGVGFGASFAAALVLAPVAVLAVMTLAARVGPRTAIAAGIVYAALPLAGRLYFYGAFLKAYDHDVMPGLVGLRHTGWFAAGVAIALFAVLVPERVAGAVAVVAAVVAAIVWIDTSWGTLYGEFHETTWSPTLLCYLPFAGVIGLAIRRPWLAAVVGGWFAVFLLRGVHRPYYEGGLWLSLAAAAPAMPLLLTSLALLLPPLPSVRRLLPRRAD